MFQNLSVCLLYRIYSEVGREERITRKELYCLSCYAETGFDCHFIVECSYIGRTWGLARRLRFYFQNSLTWFSAHFFTSEPLLPKHKHGIPCLWSIGTCVSWTGVVRVPDPQEIIRPNLHCRGGHKASHLFHLPVGSYVNTRIPTCIIYFSDPKHSFFHCWSYKEGQEVLIVVYLFKMEASQV